MIVWHRPNGAGNVVEDAERYDGMLADAFPQNARSLREIETFLGDDFTVVARERDALLLQGQPDADLYVTRFEIRPDQWLAPHKDGGILVFDEKELDHDGRS